MNTRNRRLRGLPGLVVLAAVVAAVAWVAFLASFHLAGERTPLDRLEEPLTDLRLLLAGPGPTPAGVVVVAIDDETVSRAGAYPLDRLTLARLVMAIAEGGARVLAIDLLLVDPTTPEADEALAAALGQVPAVLAAAGRFDAAAAAGGIPRTAGELWPRSPMDRTAAVGLVNVSTDSSGTPRHLPLIFRTSRGLTPSFSLRAAALAAGQEPVFGAQGLRLGDRVVPLDLAGHLPLRFLGPRGTIETLSAAHIMEGGVPDERLRDRIAVMGVTATAVGDTFATPFDPVMPGVEVLATGIAQILEGQGLVRDDGVRTLDVALTILLAVLGTVSVATLPLTTGLAIAGVVLIGWLAGTAVLFAEGYWMSAVLPLAGVLPPIAAVTALRQVHDRRHADVVLRSVGELRRFQAPALASRLERDPDFLREPVEREIAIVFIDLKGFTGVSEDAGTGWTRDFLREFYVLVEDVASTHHGVVLNFMGDGALIVFGVPDERQDDGAQAVEAAFALVESFRLWVREAGDPANRLDLRVGGHLGPVVLSRLGTETHQQITATGDSVNVASRLMEVAKANGATVALSADLMAHGAGRAWRYGEADEMRTVEVRGRREALSVALWRLPASSPRPS